MRKRKQPKPAPATIKFLLTVPTWRRIRWACEKEGLYLTAKSIQKYVGGALETDCVEIDVPVDLLSKLARACANYGIGAGHGFAVAASSHAGK